MNYQFVSLKLGGEQYDFIYDSQESRVYPRLFPGIDIQPFRMGCGMKMEPDILKKIILDKITILDKELKTILQKLNNENEENN